MKSSVIEISGSSLGPRVLVIGGVHGDERLGIEILDALGRDFSSEDILGSLTLLIGNPSAYDRNLRFLDVDLNRLAGVDEIQRIRELPESSRNREERRILELVPLIQNSDYLLDIHCTIQPSEPFVFCSNTPGHLETAKVFGELPVVSLGMSEADLCTGTDFLADAIGGMGHTLEAGWLRDHCLFKATYDCVLDYLSYVGCLSTQRNRPEPTTVLKHLMIYQEIRAESSSFSFCIPEIHNFSFVAAGEVFARDGDTSFRTERDSYLVFPKASFAPGRVAVNLASMH
jgi:succinylglutamate desuccinylase